MAAKRPQRDDNLLEDIQRRPETLNKSERKVAEAILRDPTAANRRQPPQYRGAGTGCL